MLTHPHTPTSDDRLFQHGQDIIPNQIQLSLHVLLVGRVHHHRVLVRNQDNILPADTVEETPYSLLHHITQRIITEVPGVNYILYDLTPKPTGTIEWE